MRILILTPRSPWPPVDGGRVAMARLAQSLHDAGADVHVLSLNPQKQRARDLAAPLPLELIDIDTSRLPSAILRSLTSNVPALVTRFWSDAFAARLRDRLAELRPGIVQIESPFLLPYAAIVRSSCRARIVLRSLNVEFEIWERLAASRSGAARLVLQWIASSLRRYEVRTLNDIDALIPITRDDAERFHLLGCRVPMHVSPCGATPVDDSRSAAPLSVGFIGSLDFRPNQDAVLWCVEEIMPRIRTAVPHAQLTVAGSGAPEWLRERLRDAECQFVGRVADANEFLQSQSILLAPIFAGSGMRIKILDAMAAGRAVVSTTLGAAGIGCQSGRDILLADDASSFASAVVSLLNDPTSCERIGQAARETVRCVYANETIARELLTFYERLER